MGIPRVTPFAHPGGGGGGYKVEGPEENMTILLTNLL